MRRGALLLMLAAGGCNDMVQQPRVDDYERSPLFADGKALQAPPDGTVDRAAAVREQAAARPPLTETLIRRGRQRYGDYCAMCHGLDGRGDGILPARGFPRPPSLLDPRIASAPSQHVFDVITNGYGVMYSHADRVAAPDRWAIAAYVRALQRSGGARAR
jgi:mono/diheme cytochrome c family protein